MNFNAAAFMALAATALTASPAFAGIAVDCSKVAQGQVVVTSTVVGANITIEDAAKKAYACLITGNKAVQAARSAAVAKAKLRSDDAGRAADTCSAGEIQTLVLSNWQAGRPQNPHDVNGVIMSETGGDTTLLIREPMTCGSYGTGLFEGIVSATTLSLSIVDTDTFSMDDDKAPSTAMFEIKLNPKVEL